MRALVNEVLDSGRLSYGPLSKQFESSFASLHGRQEGVLSNSGTSSLVVALQTLKEMHGWADGDEVIVPALTFVATVNAVLHCRLAPVLVDVDPLYYGLNPMLVEAAITSRTRCILPVHPFGLGADMPTLSAIATHRGLRIIEDSCEAMLVDAGPLQVGAWGDIGCFSFYVAHFITGGVGGIGITSEPDIARHMRSLVNHGIDLTELPSGRSYDPSWLARKFSFSRVGHSFRITELEAALLLPQLAELPQMIRQRQAHADKITGHLMGQMHRVQLPAEPRGWGHSYMVYPIVLRYGSKLPVMRHLRNSGVECRDMLPLTTQPCYKYNPELYPVANHINRHGFYIGCHQGLTQANFDHLFEVFGEIFGE